MKLTEQQMQLLNQLEDIQLPDPIGWWPLSSTWWLLIFMIGTLLIGVIWYYLDQKKRNAYRTEALAHLATLENSTMPPNQQLLEINALLKKVALTRYSRTEVAPLHDEAWLVFLAKTAAHVKQPPNLMDALALAYQKPTQPSDSSSIQEEQYALNNFKQYAREWIKGHHQ